MYICICNGITDTYLKQIIEENPNITFDNIQEMGIADNCYKCVVQVKDFLIEEKENAQISCSNNPNI